MENTHLSIVSPIYGCKNSLFELVYRIVETVSKITDEYEILLVDDNSFDDSWITIKELNDKNNRVKGIKFSRNFGQHKAIFAGLENSKGEWIVVMDCDLQDRPEEIFNLYQVAVNDNVNMVLGKRTNRNDKLLKKQFSRLFYKVLGFLTDTTQDSEIANFGIYNRKVISAICSMGDSFKYLPTMASWVGFQRKTVEIQHDERVHGETTYSFRKLLRLGIDVILAFSEKPLKLVIKLGLLISFLSFVLAIITVIKYINGSIHVIGYSSQILSIWFLGGTIIFICGIIGLYLGKAFDKIKARPNYIIEEEIL